MTEPKQSFWSTLPGVLTAIGAVIAAFAALITALVSAGLLRSEAPIHADNKSNSSPTSTAYSRLSYKVSVGSTPLSLPIPSGFLEASSLVPEVRKIGEQLTPSDNRLLAMFVPEEFGHLFAVGNKPDLTNCLVVQILREDEATQVSSKEFDEYKRILTDSFPHSLRTAAPEAQAMIDRVPNVYQNAMSSNFDKTVSLGVFGETSDSISLAGLTKMAISSRAKTERILYVVATTSVRVQGKVLQLLVFQRYTSKDDLTTAKKLTANWLTDLQLLN